MRARTRVCVSQFRVGACVYMGVYVCACVCARVSQGRVSAISRAIVKKKKERDIITRFVFVTNEIEIFAN